MLLGDGMSRPAPGNSEVRLIQALPGDQAVDIRDSVASAAAPAGGVATGAGGTASSGGRRFAVVVLLGIVALVGFALAQQRSSG